MMPGMKLGLGVVGAAAAALLGIAMLGEFETPGQVTVQRGFRGVAMETNYNPIQLAKYVAENKVPASLPQVSSAGPKAGQVYKNVLVLGDLSVGQFTRLMVSITQWVSPKQGCAYCHNVANMAEDTYYTKIVARRMVQMTQNINSTWAPHVWGVGAGNGNGVGNAVTNVGGAGTPGGAGVTCYTCHRGMNVPNYIWYKDEGPTPNKGGVLEVSMGQNKASESVGNSSLPYDPFTPMLEADYPIRLRADDPLRAVLGRQLHLLPQQPGVRGLVAEHAAAHLGVARHTHGARHQPQLHGPAARRVPGGAPRHLRGFAEGGLRHLPPGRVQAAVWREHGQRLPGAEAAGSAGRAGADEPDGGKPRRLSRGSEGDAANEAHSAQLTLVPVGAWPCGQAPFSCAGPSA